MWLVFGAQDESSGIDEWVSRLNRSWRLAEAAENGSESFSAAEPVATAGLLGTRRA